VRLSFEWDPPKAAANLWKHGVAFDEATTAFRDAFSITILDPDSSHEEDRFVLVGLSDRGRLLVVVHTERGDAVRLISARLATRHERQIYEEGAR
jgi:uncharacterized DUF497 family protein